MHSALQPRRLQRLPARARKIATAACSLDCSIQEMLDMGILMAGTPMGDLPAFLPLFFAFLDPLRIPSPREVQDLSLYTRRVLGSAEICLVAIYNVSTSLDALQEAWPRLFQWVHFFCTFRQFLPPPARAETDFYFDFLQLTRTITARWMNPTLFTSTPGLRLILFRAWAVALDDDDQVKRTRWMMDLFAFVNHKITSADEMDDIIEGAGGSLDHLAAHIVRHLALLTSTDKGPISSLSVGLVDDTMAVVDKINAFLSPEKHEDRRQLPALTASLVDRGVVEVLTASLSTIHGAGVEVPQTLHTVIFFLAQVFMAEQGDASIAVAARGGLLPGIIKCAQQALPDGGQHWKFLLVGVLAPATVFYCTLVPLRKAYLDPDVRALEAEHSFRECGLWQHWAQFARVLLQRFRLEEFRDLVSQNLACDNFKCGHIEPKSNFKRCAGCRTAFYCSAPCQTVDWRHGHRDACAGYMELYNDECKRVSNRERAFIRLVMHKDYLDARPKILHSFITNPSASFVLFDYRLPFIPASIEVHPLSEAAEKITVLQGVWADWVRRAAESEGRIQLHVALLREGDAERFWILPLRMNTPLLRLAVAGMTPAALSADGLVRFTEEFAELSLPEGYMEIH
ncbi:hypothetical protein C8R46DRAFT_184199 [Mycena filopes]|nr:hypothetical protein C8R46DRAFT_184199 [Mycena filopes]